MAKFSNAVEAKAFVDSLPAITADGSAWAGVSEESLESAVLKGVMSIDEFKIAAAKVVAANQAVAEVKKSDPAKPNFQPIKLEIDPDTKMATGGLPANLLALYNEKKELDRAAAAVKAKLETEIANMLKAKGKVPAGKEVVFGYRFGGFSFAIVDAAKPGQSKKAIAFDDLFA